MNPVNFTFSDTIAGYVTAYDDTKRTFGLKTSDGREYTAKLTPSSYARIAQNLEEGYQDATGRFAELLTPGQFVHAYGIFYPLQSGDGYEFDVQFVVFPGDGLNHFRAEEPKWWVNQVRSIADSYLKWQFNFFENGGNIDYKNYRTYLHLAGAKKKDDYLQETDTISRLVYGFSSAYLMTGEDRFLAAAEAGTEYLREHMRFVDTDLDVIYWYHGIQVTGNREQKLLSSEFGDDYDAVPMYEQIYALAGPIQTYRITGDTRIHADLMKTVKLFDEYYLDREKGGYFSHLDPVTLDPRAESLGPNRGTKNWNSVGDHAPAFLINAWLATGDEKLADFLVSTADTIVKYFPDYENSPFVQEKFFEDWSHDSTYRWQQNRAVVGHNLKIAWNLMRINSMRESDSYTNMATKIADLMPGVGSDQQRGGWYDVVERVVNPDTGRHHMVFHDRKAWWQQEQAILAYLILNGVLKNDEHLRYARESSAFYNAFFLDHDDGGVYFNVFANGLPYLMGNERFKGSHSMSGYHSTELCYLAAVYTNLLITKQPMDFYFKPKPGGFKDNILRVSPDILPKGSIKIGEVTIDGEPYHAFHADALTVTLPEVDHDIKVKVRIVPVE